MPVVMNRSSWVPLTVDHAERRVSGAGELGRRLDEPLQQRVERELGAEGDAHPDQRAQPRFVANRNLHVLRIVRPQRIPR